MNEVQSQIIDPGVENALDKANELETLVNAVKVYMGCGENIPDDLVEMVQVRVRFITRKLRVAVMEGRSEEEPF